ncbi:MAG TPA: hypothetical protein VKI44_21030, partial [Acetobacteraceae bacterium]|nr:hypothetical protein [Acetobacteraceae bacterium]
MEQDRCKMHLTNKPPYEPRHDDEARAAPGHDSIIPQRIPSRPSASTSYGYHRPRKKAGGSWWWDAEESQKRKCTQIGPNLCGASVPMKGHTTVNAGEASGTLLSACFCVISVHLRFHVLLAAAAAVPGFS